MRPIVSFFVAFMIIASSAMAGIIFTLETDIPKQAFDRLSYSVRTTMGLEKSWRPVPGPEQAERRQAVACPDPAKALVIVTGGQSNAANVVPAKYEAGEDVAVWFEGKCFPAADPLLGALGTGGSLWSPLADRVSQITDRPVLLINGAIGGTQFSDWLDDRSGYYGALLGRISSAAEAGYAPQMILWHQGETDAAVIRSAEVFERDVDNLMNRLARDVAGAQVYLFRATRCMGKHRVDGVPGINAVLKRVAEARPHVIPGFDTDTLGRNYRWDTCHFNSYGREAIVERVAPDLVRHLRDEETDLSALDAREAAAP